tara:strand:+ start:144 stop:332 length:189 start_codon:yes stop_codon:yes gene_type:complete
MNATTATQILAQDAAQHAVGMIAGLVANRREACIEFGKTMTDDEMVASVKASLLQLLAEKAV